MGNSKKASLIYNPAAGRYPSRILAERAADVLRGFDWEISVERTQDAMHLTRLAEAAVQAGMDALFVAGGDGSINKVLAGLVGSETALGVLPAGTSNVLAQELGLPGLSWTRLYALEESARRLAEARIHMVDVGYCGDVPFLLWAGVGLDGFVIHRIEPRSRWDKNFAVMQYAASVAWHAAHWGGMNLEVTGRDQNIRGHFLLGVVSNIRLYAGGMAALSPEARLDDGSMDLWLFEGNTLGDTVQAAWDLLSGRHVSSSRTRQVRFERLSLESDSELFVQVDGEPVDIKGRVEVSIQSKALRLLVPQHARADLFISQSIS